MMRIKQLLAMAIMLAASTTMSAQDKLFTLEDLNYGGNNYANLRPKNMWLTWWGDKLVNTDVEACYLIDKKDQQQVPHQCHDRGVCFIE